MLHVVSRLGCGRCGAPGRGVFVDTVQFVSYSPRAETVFLGDELIPIEEDRVGVIATLRISVRDYVFV